jgi:hypothetical protein
MHGDRLVSTPQRSAGASTSATPTVTPSATATASSPSLSFADIMKIVESGGVPPGIKHVPESLSLLAGQPTLPTLAPLCKPWERSAAIDAASVHGGGGGGGGGGGSSGDGVADVTVPTDADTAVEAEPEPEV